MDELDFTKRVLDAVMKIDELADSTTDESVLLAGIVDVLRSEISCDGVALLMFSEKGDLRPVGSQGQVDFDVGRCRAIADKFDTVREGEILYVPLGLDKAEGIFVLRKQGGFSEDDERLADAIESQADSRLEHVRTFSKLESRAKELEVLYEIDRIRDSTPDFDRMIELILLKIIETIPSKTGFIVLYNKKGEISDIKTDSKAGGVEDSRIRELSSDTIDEAKLLVRQDSLSVPLILEKSVIGVFGVIDSVREDGFSSQDQRILKAIASQADTAIFEDQKKRRIKDVFKRYVPENIVEDMLEREDEDFMSGKRQVMSVLFADIRGFTSFSERTPATVLVDYINMYLSAMTEVIMSQEGTLDKFVGDEVMALFGAPIWREDHAVVAVRTAVEMQKRMRELNAYWKTIGDDQLHIGIGINSGEMVVGNIGCEKMADYTVLGDNVNLGARLCGLAKPYQIVIPRSTYDLVKDHFECRPLDPVKVKGKERPVEIFEVVY